MQNSPSNRWLRRVCAHLRPGRRREAIRRELTGHLEDRIRLLRTQGLTDEEAEQQAVDAMGSPDMLGRALAELYHPLRRFRRWIVPALFWILFAALAIFVLLRVIPHL